MLKKYTVDSFAKEFNLTRQSAINKLSRLKKKYLVTVSGGGNQIRIYTVSNLSQKPTNGFYDVINKYSVDKLVPSFSHYVYGKYQIEKVIVDGLKILDTLRIKNIRISDALIYLFPHVTNWKFLMQLAKKYDLTDELYMLYHKARKKIKCRKMPKRYER